MDKKSNEEIEKAFEGLMNEASCEVDAVLALISEAPSAKVDGMVLQALKKFSSAGDFASTWKVLFANRKVFEGKRCGVAMRDVLKNSTKDRLVLSFIDSVGFDVRDLNEACGRLNRLLGFTPGAFVINATWGLGEIKRLDYFYRRLTVDFRVRKGHQMTFQAAVESLKPAHQDHLLVLQRVDPVRVETLIKDAPGDFVLAMIDSFGDMPVTRLEELSVQYGFLKKEAWKSFWDRARADLHKNKLVEIPTRRAEPIHVRKNVEDYGDTWLSAFAANTDPKCILSSVRELQSAGRKDLDDDYKAKLSDRLAFALKGAKKTDDALYARIAFAVTDLGLAEPDVSKARNYLWSDVGTVEDMRYRFLDAARDLPAREIGNLVSFLTVNGTDADAKAKLYALLPSMNFPMVSEVLSQFVSDPECEKVVVDMLKAPHPPATLITYILARWESFKVWSTLPSLILVLGHAIALGEGRQSGETLKMQNTIRRLFADEKWLQGIFAKLNPVDQAILFDRFQASMSWDPSTHNLIVARMTRFVPALEKRRAKRVEVKSIERITSLRSYAERKAAYLNLINVEVPKNVRDIEEARSKGDLRENAEYQYAKDKERELIAKQEAMEKELAAVKPVDFSDVDDVDDVKPGTSVTMNDAAGVAKTYTILGEWDNDLSLNIISCRSKLAEDLIGKKVGDKVNVIGADGVSVEMTIEKISLLDSVLKDWIKVPEGMVI